MSNLVKNKLQECIGILARIVCNWARNDWVRKGRGYETTGKHHSGFDELLQFKSIRFFLVC